jgi:tetratricopeptide (TPR) repeat protein
MPETVNPYIAGAPITEPRMFFGRTDVFDWISNNLSGQFADHILVIHGQRRIGKTSVLKQLPAHLPERYVPVFIDLQGRTHTTLDRFLWWLSREIVRTLRQDRGILIDLPDKDAFADDPEAFDGQFLAKAHAAIGSRSLVLTFDEFDALDQPQAKEQLAGPLIDYLIRLMGRPQMNFIYSIGSSGRKLENMQASYTAFFKTALYKKISFLSAEETVRLITRPVDGVLDVDPSAAQRIYEITSGHPYFTQLICHEVFARCQQSGSPDVHENDVLAVLDDVVERGTVNLKFVWDDATDLEKWVLAGIAQLPRRADAGAVASFLRSQLVRYVNKDLESALLHLREKEVLTGDNQFVVWLLKNWLLKNRPLERVREELTEANPIANRYIEIGLAYKDGRAYDKAIESFSQALAVDPHSIQAQASIGAVYLEMGNCTQAVAEFEKALQMDEEDVVTRTGLCDAHLAVGSAAMAQGKTAQATAAYQQVLAINPEHAEARRCMATLHRELAEQALHAGKPDEAQDELRSALVLAPDDPVLADQLARLQSPPHENHVAADAEAAATEDREPAQDVPTPEQGRATSERPPDAETREHPPVQQTPEPAPETQEQNKAERAPDAQTAEDRQVQDTPEQPVFDSRREGEPILRRARQLPWQTLSKLATAGLGAVVIVYMAIAFPNSWPPFATAPAITPTPTSTATPTVTTTSSLTPSISPSITPGGSSPTTQPTQTTPGTTPGGTRVPTSTPTRTPMRTLTPSGIGKPVLIKPENNNTDVTGKTLDFAWNAPPAGIPTFTAYQVNLEFTEKTNAGDKKWQVAPYTLRGTSVTADIATMLSFPSYNSQFTWFVCVVDMTKSPQTNCISDTKSEPWSFYWRKP